MSATIQKVKMEFFYPEKSITDEMMSANRNTISFYIGDGKITEEQEELLSKLITEYRNNPAQFYLKLGEFFEKGIQFPIIEPLALIFYSKASEVQISEEAHYSEEAKFSAEAQFRVGNIYESYILKSTGSTASFAKENAVKYYLNAIERGEHVEARYRLGIMYFEGNKIDQNLEKASELLKQAAMQGHVLAKKEISKLDTRDKDNKIKQQFAAHKILADLGNSEAQYRIARALLNGLGCEMNQKAAVEYYTMAADQNHGRALNSLGFIFQNGLGVPKNAKLSFDYYMKSAELGDAGAQLQVFGDFFTGRGCKQNLTKAMEWLQKAAEAGNAGAQANLGSFLLLGHGMSRNVEKAAEWFQKAAIQGDAGGQYNLAFCKFNGVGVAKDEEGALALCQKAAEQGEKRAIEFLPEMKADIASRMRTTEKEHKSKQEKQDKIEILKCLATNGDAKSLFVLGIMYEEGQGVQQDLPLSVDYYRKAAELQNPDAQFKLSLALLNGKGCEPDSKRSIEWLQKAAAGGCAGAQNNLGAYLIQAQDVERAITWLKKAALQQHQGAKDTLADISKQLDCPIEKLGDFKNISPDISLNSMSKIAGIASQISRIAQKKMDEARKSARQSQSPAANSASTPPGGVPLPAAAPSRPASAVDSARKTLSEAVSSLPSAQSEALSETAAPAREILPLYALIDAHASTATENPVRNPNLASSTPASRPTDKR